jgi:hypothetical protein
VRRRRAGLLFVLVTVVACGVSSSESTSGVTDSTSTLPVANTTTSTNVSTTTASSTLSYVAFGDSWPALGETWSTNFDQILNEIETLREGNPTAIRLVNGANPFVLYPEDNEGMPPDFATTGGTLIFDLLAGAMCDAAAAHEAMCIDARPLIEVSEDSPESMQAVADALAAAGLAELD